MLCKAYQCCRIVKALSMACEIHERDANHEKYCDTHFEHKPTSKINTSDLLTTIRKTGRDSDSER